MQTEIEAKFLDVNHDDIRVKLKEIGAQQVQPLRLMRRKNFDFPDLRLEKEKVGWVRVRDEGDKVTLSYKQLNDRTLHGTKEVSVEVNSFEETCKLLENIGLTEQSYQETKRESWVLGSSEIELDIWPWIKPFIEIESSDEKTLRDMVEKLGLKFEDAVHGSVEIAYQAEYDVTEDEVDHWKEILFIPIPDWLKKKSKA
ncbi:CYTH domain-containing protein [Candidatus Saccharibacteria bacterium]|nr:CYTH domain-containing protein [Candidatus Saccharibacteria bacterium]MCA9342749.1 CYTH domain-containing protein [Candidatus Saccharibacteria bacterium]